MMHGVSSHTVNAEAAIDYCLDEEYFDKEEQTWKRRDPPPELLEGNPMQMRALCDSLPYKNKYVSAVLSFTKKETELIDNTPGMKEAIIEDLRNFIYAGFKNEDSKVMLITQHTHLDRLEMHYQVPRVNLESGLSFSPFPVRYDDTAPGAKNLFIEQNNAFVDHMCEKYGLQNPRDPAIERAYKDPSFEKYTENKDIRKHVVATINELIDCGKIKSRDDMTSFLKDSGAEITRQGKDYFSFKFPEMKQAIKLKGELYGEQSFEQIGKNFEQRKEDFEESRENAQARYAEVNDRRADEIEGRHGKRRDEAERAEHIDPGAERELRDTANTLENQLGSLGRDVDNVANDAIRAHPGLMSAVTMGGGGGGGGGAEVAETSAGKTGNPVLDELISSFHAWLKAQAKKRAAAVSASFPGPQSPATKKGILDYIKLFADQVKFKASVATGYNLVEPGRGKMTTDDMKLYRKAITDQLKEANRDIKELERLHKAQDRVKTVREPMDLTDTVKRASGPGLATGNGSLKALADRWKEDQKERQQESGKKRKRDVDFEM